MVKRVSAQRVKNWNDGLSKRAQFWLIMICQQAEHWHEMLHRAKSLCGLSEIGEGVDPEFALCLRRNHDAAWGCLWSLFTADMNERTMTDPRCAYRGMIAVSKRPRLLAKIVNRIWRDRDKHPSFDEWADQIITTFPNDLLRHVAVGIEYIANVWLPCTIVHRATPVEIRRQARLTGSADQIADMLRLDKMMRLDPIIAQHIERFRLEGNKSAIERIMIAEQGKLITNKKDTHSAIKATAGAMAKIVVGAMGEDVGAMQIKRTYDWLATQKPGGWLHDPHIKYNSFRDRLRLEVGRWMKALPFRRLPE